MTLSHEQLDQLLASLSQDDRWAKIPVNISEQAINELREHICDDILEEHLKKIVKPKRTRKPKASKRGESEQDQ